MPIHLLRPLTFLTLALPVAAQAPRLLPQTADALLPASTYAVARFGGLAACREATGGMPVAAAVQAFLQKLPAEVRDDHLDRGLEQAAEEVQAACQQVGLRPADVRAVLGRPMTVAVGRLSVEGFGPSVALLVEPGEHRKEVNRLVQWGAQMIAQQTGGAVTDEAEIGGLTFHSLQLNEGPVLFAGAIGSCYVISNSRGFLGEMVAVAGGKQPPLTSASRLGALTAELPAPALASLFLNADRVLSAFAPHLPYEAEAWSAALGLGALDAVYWASTATAHGGSDLLHVGIGGSERGLLKALLAAPADLSFAKACSANTVLFAAGSLDVPGVVDAFGRFAELLPAAARDEMMRELRRDLGRELRQAGTTPQEVDGIVRAFGSQVGMALALEKGAVPKPELLVRLAVRDAAVVDVLLQKLEGTVTEATGLQWKTRQADAHAVRFCNVQLQEVQLQLSPCYVLTQDALWLGSDAAALVRALRQDAEQSLAAQPDFQDLAKASAGASGVMHWRLFRAAEIGWRTVETMAYPQIDAHRDQLGFGSEALPDAETMAKALGTTSCIYRVDDVGVSFQSHGTLTNGALLAAFGMLGDEVLGRASARLY